ncbi:MAG: GAF domain-containing sensor histidine kinase [Eggerthellaceae bacterium]|nr:GAF domain-containing sensor histidine kinase [Eggerthellaceae bacterium]
MTIDRYAALLAFCEAMEWAPDSETVYQRIVDAASRTLKCDVAALHLFEVDGKQFLRHALHTDEELASLRPVGVSVTTGRLKWLIENQALIEMDYLNQNSEDVIPASAVEAGYRSAVSIPLVSGNAVTGTLSLVYRTPLPFDDGERAFLLSLGRVIGLFLNRVQMSKKDLELQMLRERKRLGNEIHDNIAQMVSALGIKADTALSCLEDGDYDDLESQLEELADLSRQVTKVLRTEMLSLRAPLEGAEDLVEGVVGLLKRFEEQWGIPVEIDSEVTQPTQASDYVRMQLARIVNECLQNVLRHAHADHVFASIRRKNGTLLISIRDDGVGFDVAAVAPERLGLRIMRERAQSAGGLLSVASGAQGTSIFIEMPISSL